MNPYPYPQGQHPQGGYPQYPQGQYQPYPQHQHTQPTGPIACPKCGKPTASLKQYVLCNLLVFLYVFAFMRRGTYTACASCMRGIILMRTLINLVPANLLWFIVVAPWHTVQFIRTFADGHSDSVRAMTR